MAEPIIVDFRNQDNMFLVLEEFGVSYMQKLWVEKYAPEHQDRQELFSQYEEIAQDLVTLLSGAGDSSRYVDNGWVGATLAEHLRKTFSLTATDATRIVRQALVLYEEDLSVLMQMEQDYKEKRQKKLHPSIYIGVMIAWSGVFCGKKDRLERPAEFRQYRLSIIE